ncbi:MAG: DUF1289 domain-containing protein [Bacteroidales bacterium]|nr:DUF1289 domain-containing protein [Bacteroidales bacterium]
MLKNKSSVKSPCIHVCTLDENKICMGCHRSVDEVRNWYRFSDEEKLQAIKNAEERRRKNDENIFDHYV